MSNIGAPNSRRIAFAAAGISIAAVAGCSHYDDNCCFNPGGGGPVLSILTNVQTIGSTTDATGKGSNPYGLDIAKTSLGLIEAGDLIACNFNDVTNTQGQGDTVVALHPNTGATPILIAQSTSLLGCSALAALPDGNIVVAANTANALALVSPTGSVSTPFSADTFHNPWGIAYAQIQVRGAAPVLYVSNSGDGSIDRITLNIASDTQTAFTEIATGFAVSGVPGSILAPSGLSYDGNLDTLYVMDPSTNSVVALNNVSQIDTDGVTVTVSNGTDHFSGPSAASAQVIASGSPLNGPISASLLPSGNLIVGNTLDPAGTNLLLEVSNNGGGVLAKQNVDTGAAGALFGIVTGYDSFNNTVVFFNDDNDNTVKVLTQ